MKGTTGDLVVGGTVGSGGFDTACRLVASLVFLRRVDDEEHVSASSGTVPYVCTFRTRYCTG